MKYFLYYLLGIVAIMVDLLILYAAYKVFISTYTANLGVSIVLIFVGLLLLSIVVIATKYTYHYFKIIRMHKRMNDNTQKKLSSWFD